MATLNPDFLAAVASAARQKSDATIVTQYGSIRRAIHVSRGELVGSESTVKADRLGDLLASRGRLDAALIEPLDAEAKKNNRLLGEQLIRDGLITAPELALLLEEQVTLRFNSTLLMSGDVTVGPRQQTPVMVRKPLGALVLAAFRDKVGVDALGPLLANKPERFTQFPTEAEVYELALQPWESRAIRRFATETVAQVIQSNPSPEKPLRLIAALVGLGYVR